MTTLSVGQTATIVHGYTMANIDDMADLAFRTAWRGRGFDESDRREAAWHAIVVELYTNYERPERHELVRAGRNAILEFVDEMSQTQGRRARHDYEESPRFKAYWLHVTSSADDFTEGLTERMALPQVLAILSPAEYEAIIALATHRQQTAAAEALGISEAAMNARIAGARKRIMRLWFEHETPRDLKTTPDRCKWGHSFAEHGVRKADGRVHCGKCGRDSARRSQRRRRDGSASPLSGLVSTP